MADHNLELALRIRAAVQGAESVEELQRRFDDLIDELRRGEEQAHETDQSFDGLGRGAGKLGDAFQALAGLAVIQQFVEINRRAEALKNTLTALSGSQQKAAEEIEWLAQTANRLGVAVDDVSQAYISLSTSSKGTQLEGQKTRDIFEAIIGAMATMGRTGQDAEQAITAIAQMMGKGVIQAEELTGQLEEALPGASRALAAALGVSVAELREMSEAGTLLSSDTLPALAAEIKKTYGESASGSTTMSAQLARLQNAVTAVFTQIGEAGALQAFKEGTIIAAVGGRMLYGVLELLGTAAGALTAALVNMDFSQFSQTLKDTTDRITRENAAIAQYSDTLVNLNPNLRKTAESSKALAAAQEGAATSNEKAGGSLAKLQYQYQQLNEKMERTLALLDRKVSAQDAWATVLKNEAALQGDLVRQTQLGIDLAAKDADLKQKQATEMARLADEAERNVKNLTQQSNITPQILEAAEQDALAKQKQADSAAAAAVAAKIQADAVKGANTIILESLGQQGESAEVARAKAQHLRSEYEQMRAAGASLDQLAIKLNSVVQVEDAARAAARGYREEQAITTQQLDQLKDKLNGSVEGQSAYNTALQRFARQQQLASDQLSRRNALIEQAREADIAATHAAADLAEARGDEAEAGRLRMVALQQELNLAREQITLRRAEKSALENIVATKEREADADKVRTQEELAAIQTVRDAVTEKQNQISTTEAAVKSKEAEIEATRQEAEATEAAAEAAKKKADAEAAAAKAAQEETEKSAAHIEQLVAAADASSSILSASAQKALQSMNAWSLGTQATTIATDELKTALEQQADFVRKNADAIYYDTLATAQMRHAIDAMKGVMREYADSLDAAGKMQTELAEKTEARTLTMADLNRMTRATETGLKYLDEEHLDELRAAIADAKSKMDDLRQASADALDEAQRALLQQQGDDLALAELDRKKTLLDLQERINAAQAAGDQAAIANLQQAIDLQEKTYDLKVKALEQAAAEKAAQASSGQTTTTTTTTTTPTPAIGSPITVNMAVQSLDLTDARALDQLGRRLMPVMDNIRRRLA